MSIKEVSGIEYCHVHDDVAIEGYDWSDRCQTAYREGSALGTCALTPVLVERRGHVEADQANPHGMARLERQAMQDCEQCGAAIGDGDYVSGHRSCALCRGMPK